MQKTDECVKIWQTVFNSCLYNLAFLQILMRLPSLDKIDDSGGLNMCGQYAVLPTLIFDKIIY